MPSIVEIIIKTIDESSGATGNIIGSFTEMQSAIGLVKEGIQGMRMAYDATIGSVVSYDDSIRSVSAATGMSAEQTSKMIDLTDNFGISTGALTMAQKNLAKDGYSLNIDTLKALGHEYDSLGTQAEKTTFLVQKFGRSGMEFAEMFDYGSASMEKYYNGSADGMVRTKEQIRSTLDLTIAQKDLGDAWQGLTNKVATPMIPGITSYIKTATDELASFTSGNAADAIGFIGHQYQLAFGLIKDTSQDAAKGVDSSSESLKRMYSVTAPTTEQLAALTQQYSSQLNMTMQISQQTDAFTSAQNNLAQKIYATREELDKTKGVYYQGGQHVTELKNNLADLQSQYDANTQANDANMNKQIYADYLKMNSGKQLTSETYKQEQDVAVALGLTTDAERKKAEAVFQLNQRMSEGKLSAQEYADSIKQALAGTPSLTGVDAAKKWMEEHPSTSAPATTSSPAASATTNATPGTDRAQAQHWLDSQKQAKATEDSAKKATSAMAADFTEYSNTVTKQSDAAQKSVKSLVEQLSGLAGLGSFTISVTGNTASAEYP